MAKPFSIQSPEDIAKEYAGNKQKIAQAMQMGIVDPTAGVLAGMFIDRMRSAQMQEQAPQTTVAQQVMGGVPPVPANPLPAGGLGSPVPAAPPMTPPMGMAPPMPEAPPMGMADGGLASLPVPDAMFDEPTNGGFDDGYAGGGIVAFSDGGPISTPEGWGEYIEQMAQSVAPNLRVTSRRRSAAKNAAVGGAADSYHMLGAARDFVPPPGMSMSQLHAQLKQKFGSGYDVINEGDHIHIEPGPALGRAVRAGTPFDPANVGRLRTAESAPRPAPATAGLAPPTETLESMLPAAFKAGEEYYAANMPKRKNEGLDLLVEQARAVLDPAAQKKQRDEDKWMTLAEIGFNMAASNSPFLLQAASAAAAAALPGARAAKKEREATKREAIRDLAAAEDITYKQAAERVNAIRDFATVQLGLKDKDLTRASNVWERMFSEEAQTERTRMTIQGEKEVAGIKAAADAAAAANPGITQLSPSGLVEFSQQQRMLMEQAIKDMQAAEKQGDSNGYANFRAAVNRYGASLNNYNTAAQKLGMQPMPPLQMQSFPKMNSFRKERLAKEQAAGGTGGKKSSAMEEADRIIAGGR